MKKNYLCCLLLLLFSILFPWKVEGYSAWDQERIFFLNQNDHSFTIRFNADIDPKTLTKENIYVLDTHGRILPTNIRQKNQNTIQVLTQQIYSDQEDYILVLTSKIASTQGAHLSQEIRMPFMSGLQLALAHTKTLYEKAIEGTLPGEYAHGSKQRLWLAITKAQNIRDTKPDYNKELSAIQDLRAAIKKFYGERVQFEKQTLDIPKVPDFDENALVTFTSVDGARAYELTLYKGDAVIASAIILPKNLSHSFQKKIHQHGEGTYTVTVRALGEGNILDSQESKHSSPIVSGRLPAPVNLSWSAHRLYWNVVPHARFYEVSLIKNGSLEELVHTNLPNHDFTALIEKNLKSGTYTATVRAIANEDSIYGNSMESMVSPMNVRHSMLERVGLSTDKKTVTLYFDDAVQNNLSGIAELKNNIFISRNGMNAQPLTDEVILSIGGKEIQMRFPVPISSSTQIRILKNAISDRSYQPIVQDIITAPFSGDSSETPPQVTVISSSPVDNLGGKVQVQSTKQGLVYLLKENSPLHLPEMDIAVHEKKAMKVSVLSNTPKELFVAGLPKGNYRAVALDENGVFSDYSSNLVTILDKIQPILTASAQAAKNIANESIRVKLNEEGILYLVNESTYPPLSAGQTHPPMLEQSSTIADLKTNHKLAEISVPNDKINKEVFIATQDLIPGNYHIFAKDEDGNWSAYVPGTMLIRDGIKPILTFIPGSAPVNNNDATVSAKSNEQGTVYLLLDHEAASRVEDLENSSSLNMRTGLRKGSKARVNDPSQDAVLSTKELMEGKYYAYAVDLEGNLSERSGNYLTVQDQSPPRVIAKTQNVLAKEGHFIQAMSTETGAVYLIHEEVKASELDDVIEAIDQGNGGAIGTHAVVTNIQEFAQIPVQGLKAGSYVLYACDASQRKNRSEPLTGKIKITLP